MIPGMSCGGVTSGREDNVSLRWFFHEATGSCGIFDELLIGTFGAQESLRDQLPEMESSMENSASVCVAARPFVPAQRVRQMGGSHRSVTSASFGHGGTVPVPTPRGQRRRDEVVRVQRVPRFSVSCLAGAGRLSCAGAKGHLFRVLFPMVDAGGFKDPAK